ncbi:helix-turn-helix domain-containing protein [Candidatus Woesearchaeota archaeon]|nr:helix-turn-helix domain-containing protein [Candidatus Woesearchaeota archaeon]
MLTKKEYQVLELRTKKKLTQVEVAKQLKISQAAVSKFERTAIQKIKNAHKIIEISERLGIKLEDDAI